LKVVNGEGPKVQLAFASVLKGAVPFSEGNINDTFRGQILKSDQTIAHAVLKDLPTKQLVNELAASSLAHSHGLPTPNVYLARVEPGILSVSKGPTLSDGSHIVFASEDVKVPNVAFSFRNSTAPQSDLLIATLIKWKLLGGLYAFDTWIANTDRHAGNLLFGGGDDVWLIDHGHSFTGPNWKSGDLKPDIAYGHRLKEWLTPRMTSEQRLQKSKDGAKFVNAIDKTVCSNVAQNSGADAYLTPPEDTDLGNFVSQRVDFTVKITNDALGVPTVV
jgi:hypothetical protein